MNSNILEIKEFLKDNKFKYLEFLSEIDGFPYVCDISSSILNVYLYKRFNIKCHHLDGAYNDEVHFWLQIPNLNTIIDFVEFQFNKELCHLPVSELKLKLDNNYPFVEKDNDIYENYFPFEAKCLNFSTLLGVLDDYNFDYYLECARELLIEQGYIKKSIKNRAS